MLNDDGVVLDDGTTTRLAETRYFMTTTTAQAGEVMSWLEFLLQTAWTDLKRSRRSPSPTSGPAMSVVGPESSRGARAGPCRGGISLIEASRYMGCLEIDFDGVPLRLLRLSFSGELAYELYVPADYGVALWEQIARRAVSRSA